MPRSSAFANDETVFRTLILCSKTQDKCRRIPSERFRSCQNLLAIDLYFSVR